MTLNLPQASEKRDYVQNLFGRIAKRYDLLNKIISFGQDSCWRKRVVNILQPVENHIYLDIGTGTGDLAQEIISQQPNTLVVAADLTLQMLLVGKNKINSPKLQWIVADAQALPFRTESFDGVVSGYLLRNVPDQKKVLMEQIRVIGSGSNIISLDTTPPNRNWTYPFISAYFRFVIPFIGKLLSGDAQAYSYLPGSTINHTPADQLAQTFRESGFESVEYIKLMLGTMAIHSGRKPVPLDEKRSG